MAALAAHFPSLPERIVVPVAPAAVTPDQSCVLERVQVMLTRPGPGWRKATALHGFEQTLVTSNVLTQTLPQTVCPYSLRLGDTFWMQLP